MLVFFGIGLVLLVPGIGLALRGRPFNGAVFIVAGLVPCFIGWLMWEARDISIGGATPTEVSCREDFNCWTNKFQAQAARDCAPLIEQLALTNYRWTDNFISPKFPRAATSADGAQITYVGDAIEFQNGLGSWIRHTYSCSYDTNLKTALSVNAKPGTL